MYKNNLQEFFSDCGIIEVLNKNVDISFVCLLGEKQGKKFVVKLKKKEYDTLSVQEWEKNLKSINSYQLTFDNDIYTKYTLNNFLTSEVSLFTYRIM
jgi:hypothetical protein